MPYNSLRLTRAQTIVAEVDTDTPALACRRHRDICDAVQV